MATEQLSAVNLKGWWQQLWHSAMGLIGLTMLLIAIIVALLAPWLAPYDPEAPVRVTLDNIYAAPSAEHWLGTDDAGKDVFSNFIYGTRVSLLIAFVASFISICIGGTVGIVAGFYGGRIENFLMRFTDILLVIPDLPLMIVIIAMTKPSLANIILVIGILYWTSTARLVRSQTLAVKERKFVLRARALGASNLHIIRRHIFPLVLPIMVVNAVLVISSAVVLESALAFLGLGDPTTISWGQMLEFAFYRGAMSSGAWWALVTPGFGIVWVALGCILLGNGLERIFNPRLTIHHLAVGPKMIARRKPAAEPEGRLPAPETVT
jgi:peptide/nickel transport system permease protein